MDEGVVVSYRMEGGEEKLEIPWVMLCRTD